MWRCHVPRCSCKFATCTERKQRQHQSERQLGDCRRGRIGCVRDPDAAPLGRQQIDAVETDSDTRDELQSARSTHYKIGNWFSARNQHVEIRHHIRQFHALCSRRPSGLMTIVDARCFEQLERQPILVGERHGRDESLGHQCSPLYACASSLKLMRLRTDNAFDVNFRPDHEAEQRKCPQGPGSAAVQFLVLQAAGKIPRKILADQFAVVDQETPHALGRPGASAEPLIEGHRRPAFLRFGDVLQAKIPRACCASEISDHARSSSGQEPTSGTRPNRRPATDCDSRPSVACSPYRAGSSDYR